MTTLLFEEHRSDAAVTVRGGSPWIATGELETVTGWHLEDRGVCRGDQCIPVPSGAVWSDRDGFDLGAFAKHRGQAMAHAAAPDLWSFGPPVAQPFEGSEAPDFTLPDFEGRLHSLSDYRGKKVVLMTWASW